MEEKERNQRQRELNCQKPMVTLELKKDLMSSSIAGCSSLQPSAMQQSPLRDISRRKNVASSSVQGRPLAIDFESERLLSDNTVERETLQEDHMHRNDTRELKKPNQKSLSTHRNVSSAENCKIVQKLTDDTSTYSSGLLSWKSSVTVAFESIRERFNVFRKLKSTENEQKGKDIGKAASSNSLTRSMSANSKCQEIQPENTVHSSDDQEVTGYMLTGFDNFEEPAELESNLHVKGNKQTATVLGNQLRESVDDICSKNIVEACAESDDVIDTSPGISSATKRCQKQANNYDNALQTPKDKPVGDGSSLCGMCVRSESGLNMVSNDRIQIVCFGPENEYQSLDTAPAASETDSKIVHKQPINFAACDIYTCKNCPACLEGKSSHVIAAHLDVSSDSSVACVDQTSDISSRSVSNDLDAINSIKNTEKRKTLLSDSETKLTHISSAGDRDKPCSEESEPEKGDRETYSVYLWNLRNSLEQNTIEVKRIRSSLSDSEDCSLQCRRISIATDEMTETSPLSTPSSERLISRDKSITDSEDESRPFFVTPSGRISPRHPNYFRRNNSGFSSSTEGVNDRITCYDCDSNTIKTTLSDKDFDVSQHLFKQQTNAVVAKANVENVPRHQSKGECESQMAEKSLSKRQDQKKLGLVLTGNWSTIDSSEGDPFEDNEKTYHPAARQRTSHQVLLKQMSLSLTNKRDVNSKNASAEDNLLPSIIRFIADEDILSSVDELSVKSKGEKTVARASNCSATSDKTRHHKKTLFTSDSTSSDDVFLSDPVSNHTKILRGGRLTSKQLSSPLAKDPINSEKSKPGSITFSQTSSRSSSSGTTSCKNVAFPMSNNETTFVPPTNWNYQKCKYQTRPGSVNSSGTSSPSSPTRISPLGRELGRRTSGDQGSDDSLYSSRSSSSMRNITRLFRRSSKHGQQRSDLAPTFCGYAMSRDNCVDPETDRIFKEFLCYETVPSDGTDNAVREPLPPPSHMLPPRPISRSSATQLRRQVMRKQYSDSIAMYYGQCQRRWKFTKQKSDSVGCPVGRRTFRRQDRIEEEFDPEEINERLSSTSSRRDSDRPDYIPPTVHELKEWRRSSEDRTPIHHNAKTVSLERSLSTDSKPSKVEFSRRVTFKHGQLSEDGQNTTPL